MGFAILEMKNNGMREKRNEKWDRGRYISNKTKQTKHENLGSETFRVLNKMMHCINYSFLNT